VSIRVSSILSRIGEHPGDRNSDLRPVLFVARREPSSRAQEPQDASVDLNRDDDAACLDASPVAPLLLRASGAARIIRPVKHETAPMLAAPMAGILGLTRGAV
jgi:hypothetical protein